MSEDNQNTNQDNALSATIAELTGMLASAGTASATYTPPPRYRQVGGKWEIYDGPGLIDSNGNLLDRDGQPYFYNTDTDPGALYASLSPGKRAEVLQTLNDRGFYRSGKPGDFASDLNALALGMEYANIFGISIDRAVNEIRANIPQQGGGGGAGATRYRVSNPDDVKGVARQVSRDTIGREFTPEELDRFASSFRQQELQYQQAARNATVAVENPSAQTAAESFAQQIAPTEANAYKYLGYVNKFFNSVGGL